MRPKSRSSFDLDAEVERAAALDAERQKLRHSRTANELRSVIRALERDLALTEERLESALALDRITDRLVIPAHRKSSSGEAISWSALSDCHVEEEVLPGQISGLNSHSLAISDRKITTYFQHVVSLINLNRGGREIRKHVLWLGGDLFSGHIHEELVETTELSPTESVLWLEQRLEAGIRYLLEHADLEKLYVPCSIGNHGRTTKKPRIATAQKHSYEWLLYHHLARTFRGEKRVEFTISEGYHLLVDSGGVRVRVHHGDSVRYGGGVGGLTIPLNKAIGAWNGARRSDLDLLGHWHQLLWLPRAVVNGSLIGYSPFAVAIKAEYEPPQQAFFLLDCERKCRTVQAPIFVEHRPRKVR